MAHDSVSPATPQPQPRARAGILKVRPITRNAALPWIAEHHRHLRRHVTGWLFGIEIQNEAGERVGIAIAGRPAARMLQDGLTVEITRVCTVGHHPNACSLAYESDRPSRRRQPSEDASPKRRWIWPPPAQGAA